MNPIAKKYYQHRYGGIYRVDVPYALSTVDKTPVVVYTHVYPFAPDVWVRPLSEWTADRFRELGDNELNTFLDKNVLEFQEEIMVAKAAAKDK